MGKINGKKALGRKGGQGREASKRKVKRSNKSREKLRKKTVGGK